jgi:predicted PurR-regulated permease PerM
MRPFSSLLIRQINQVLLVLVLGTVVLYFGRPVLVPLFYAILFGMLMAPVCRWLDRYTIRAISCTLCCLVLLIGFLLVLWLMVFQLSDFLKDIDIIREKMTQYWILFKEHVESRFRVSQETQERIMQRQVAGMKEAPGSWMFRMGAGITGVIGTGGIVIVFTFLLLYHKEKYERFFLKLFAGEDKDEIKQILEKITTISQKYLTGRILSMLFLFVLYSIALLIIGLKNALLLAGIASLLTIVPYIGPFVGGLFPVLTAFVTKDTSEAAIWTIVAMVAIQAVDNYFIEPNVIGGEVSLTALSTLVAILMGGIIWGVSGMILFIPMFGIAKIVFDHIDMLKPFGYVIGDEGESPSLKLLNLFKRKK